MLNYNYLWWFMYILVCNDSAWLYCDCRQFEDRVILMQFSFEVSKVKSSLKFPDFCMDFHWHQFDVPRHLLLAHGLPQVLAWWGEVLQEVWCWLGALQVSWNKLMVIQKCANSMSSFTSLDMFRCSCMVLLLSQLRKWSAQEIDRGRLCHTTFSQAFGECLAVEAAESSTERTLSRMANRSH